MASWIPVVVAVGSAVVAGWFAAMTKRSEIRSQRLIELERRTAATKGEIFEPLIEALGQWWEKIGSEEELLPEWFEENVMPSFKRFMTWVQIYGSDETVWVVHRYMQAIYADAPVNVTMRLLAELVLALRHELGQPDSKATALDIMGFRINDIYEDGIGLAWTRLPERELYKHEGWTPPWGDRFRYGKPVASR
jgi:hypothetical protein